MEFKLAWFDLYDLNYIAMKIDQLFITFYYTEIRYTKSNYS